MKLIVGLGNPGDEYARTRHNVGFWVVDELARRYGWTVRKRAHNGLVGEELLSGEKLALLKPLTFMNRSGLAVASAVRWYKIEPRDLLVIYDDMDLEVGKLRIRLSGSSGGHKGIESIITELGTGAVPRLKIGIGRPSGDADVVGHVLSPFAPDQKRLIGETVARAADAVQAVLFEGYPKAMNRFNANGPEPSNKAAADPASEPPHKAPGEFK